MEELARRILRIWVVSRVLVLQDLVEKHVKLVRNIDHKNSKMSTRLNPSCISHIWIVVVFRCFWLNPVSKVRGGCGNQQACVTNLSYNPTPLLFPILFTQYLRQMQRYSLNWWRWIQKYFRKSYFWDEGLYGVFSLLAWTSWVITGLQGETTCFNDRKRVRDNVNGLSYWIRVVYRPVIEIPTF